MSAPTVEVGTKLPELALYGDPTFIISTAIATRDYQDVHHDRDRAIASGAKDIFLNILTTTGLVQQYVTAWAGPGQSVKAISIRLGAPCHAGDTLTLTGEVISVGAGADGGADEGGADEGGADEGGADEGGAEGTERVIAVTGRCGLGDHVTATVRLADSRSPGGPAGGKG